MRSLTAERRVEQLGEPEDRAPRSAASSARHALEGAVVARAVGLVGLGHDVRRRALEDRHRGDPVDDAGHELDRAGAGADDGDPLAGQVDVVAPLGGVEGRPGEGVDARERRDHRVGELADGGDDHVGVVRRARRRRSTVHVPAALVERARATSTPVRDQVEQALALGGVAEVGQDLGLPGVAPAPGRVDRPRPRVERRRHVAGGARDRCCRATPRRRSSARSSTMTSSMPGSRSARAAPRPPKPAPMMTARPARSLGVPAGACTAPHRGRAPRARAAPSPPFTRGEVGVVGDPPAT